MLMNLRTRRHIVSLTHQASIRVNLAKNLHTCQGSKRDGSNLYRETLGCVSSLLHKRYIQSQFRFYSKFNSFKQGFSRQKGLRNHGFISRNYSSYVSKEDVKQLLNSDLTWTKKAHEAMKIFHDAQDNCELVTQENDIEIFEMFIEIYAKSEYYEQSYECFELMKLEIAKSVLTTVDEPSKEQDETEDGNDFDTIIPEFKRVETYHYVMTSCAAVCRIQHIQHILNAMIERNVGISIETFNRAIECCIRQANSLEAMQFYDLARRLNLQENVQTIILLMKVFIQAKDQTFLKIYESKIGALEPTSDQQHEIDHILFEGLNATGGDLKKSLEIMKQFPKEEITLEHFKAILRNSEEKQNLPEITRAYQQMIELGYEPDIECVESILAVYGKKGDKKIYQVYDYLNNQHQLSGEKTLKIYNSFLAVETRNKNLNEAKKIFSEIREKGLKPNVYSHTLYGIQCYHQDWKHKMKWYQEQSERRNNFYFIPEDSLPFQKNSSLLDWLQEQDEVDNV